jgi:predicted transcriptional regulator
MTTITINLSDEQLSRLQELGSRLGVSPEDLVRVSVEQLLARPDPAFDQATEQVLQKNAELYRRLA